MAQVEIAPLADFPEGAGLRVDVGEHRIAMFKIGEAVYALGDRCSHAEASLAEGEVFDDEVECPRHGAAFDLATGEALTLPATSPVATYAAQVENGTVYLTIEEES
ncbi:MAG: non-heme iron oxygenase ferredoxin subunit [Acidimicrobiia bacterium]|nr:non-heme iron oxygenase ferredoxin subunit [Acidimicrobiia bacterium]